MKIIGRLQQLLDPVAIFAGSDGAPLRSLGSVEPASVLVTTRVLSLAVPRWHILTALLCRLAGLTAVVLCTGRPLGLTGRNGFQCARPPFLWRHGGGCVFSSFDAILRCHRCRCFLSTLTALLPEELQDLGWKFLSRHAISIAPWWLFFKQKGLNF